MGGRHGVRAAAVALALVAGLGRADTPEPRPLDLMVAPVVAGETAILSVSGLWPGVTVAFAGSRDGAGEGPCPERFGGVCLDVQAPKFLGSCSADAQGVAWIAADVPGGAVGRTLAFQAVVLPPGEPGRSLVLQVEALDPDGDPDDDGLTSRQEVAAGSDPRRADTDGDGLSDGREVRALHTDPTRVDSDGDGLDDGEEVARYRTAPDRFDTDGDGAFDGREVAHGVDPLRPDTDGDGIADGFDLHPLRRDAPDEFRIVDEVVSDPNTSMPDPEYDELEHRLVWQSMSGHQLWVGDIDPATGRFYPRDGKSYLVDVDVGPIGAGFNGPEWAFGRDGHQVSYVVDDGGEWVLWRALESYGQFIPEQMPGARTVGTTPYGSKDPQDDRPRVTFNRGGRDDPSSGWRELGDGATQTELPDVLGTIDTRWVEGGPRLLTGTSATGPYGWRQAWIYDIDTHEVTYLTDDPAHKYDSFIWNAPEFGGARVMVAARGLEEDEYTEIAVYREFPDGWQEVHVIGMPFGFPYVVSPEPVIVDGRSYVSFLASVGGRNMDNGHSSVWVASIDPRDPLVRRVSDDQLIVRKDPESYTTGAAPWVYYAEVRPDRKRVIHRCDTGLRGR